MQACTPLLHFSHLISVEGWRQGGDAEDGKWHERAKLGQCEGPAPPLLCPGARVRAGGAFQRQPPSPSCTVFCPAVGSADKLKGIEAQARPAVPWTLQQSGSRRARDVQSPGCPVSAQDISEQQPLPTEPAACSITAFHAVHPTFFSCSFFPTRTPATVGRDFCLFDSLSVSLERCMHVHTKLL